MISDSGLRVMQNKPGLSWRMTGALTAILWALVAASASTQNATENDEPTSAAETDTATESVEKVADSPVADNPGIALDYEPTESISEDLSVSFPVDI